MDAKRSPKPRRWLRFSLRTLLILTALVAVWLGVQVNRAQKQRAAVAAIQEAGGFVMHPIHDGWRGLVVEYLGQQFVHGEFLVFDVPVTAINEELTGHIQNVPQARFLFYEADEARKFQSMFPGHTLGQDVPLSKNCFQ